MINTTMALRDTETSGTTITTATLETETGKGRDTTRRTDTGTRGTGRTGTGRSAMRDHLGTTTRKTDTRGEGEITHL